MVVTTLANGVKAAAGKKVAVYVSISRHVQKMGCLVTGFDLLYIMYVDNCRFVDIYIHDMYNNCVCIFAYPCLFA